MRIEGRGVEAGGSDMSTVPLPTGAVSYSFDPYAVKEAKKSIWDQKPDIVPSEKTLRLLEKMGRLKKPEPVAPKPRKRVKSAAPKTRVHVKWQDQERLTEARDYLKTPKVCAYEPCGKTFHARENERIDGYRRRETCGRSCAAKKAKISQGWKS